MASCYSGDLLLAVRFSQPRGQRKANGEWRFDAGYTKDKYSKAKVALQTGINGFGRTGC
jgi:hypothetical protein